MCNMQVHANCQPALFKKFDHPTVTTVYIIGNSLFEGIPKCSMPYYIHIVLFDAIEQKKTLVTLTTIEVQLFLETLDITAASFFAFYVK